MYLEPVPIEIFINDKFRSRIVQKLIESWNIEPDKIVDVLVRHFRDMGILSVSFVNDRVIFDSMVFHLKTSPDIRSLVTKMRREEQMRRRSRHAE